MEDWEECRKAFVEIIKKENFEDRHGGKQSLKQNWAGPKAGFHDPMLQLRYEHFTAGWKACKQYYKS